jgi:hypothetical protein
MKKKFLVFFDEKVNGVLVEGCFGIWALTKAEANSTYLKIKPEGAIYRCTKVA